MEAPLGREGGRFWLRPERHRNDVEAVAERFGLAVDLDTEVRQLAAGVQQKVEILKSVYRGVGFESLGWGMTWWLFPRSRARSSFSNQ